MLCSLSVELYLFCRTTLKRVHKYYIYIKGCIVCSINNGNAIGNITTSERSVKRSVFQWSSITVLRKSTPLDEILFTSAQLYAPLSLYVSMNVTCWAFYQINHVKSIRGFCAQLRVGTRQSLV